MNRVGEGGRGESIWLGWFLHLALTTFAPLAEARGERLRAASWRAHAARLRASLEQHGWDGDWYRRGYFDDGTPLGSAASERVPHRFDRAVVGRALGCGGPGTRQRARWRRWIGTSCVATSAWSCCSRRRSIGRCRIPATSRRYPPGIRENGGQYTHAAIWSVIAFAMLGDGDKAAEIFSMLNPINHARTRRGCTRYKVEPYVVAADVYSEPPHVGRGGWTWYTGSAALDVSRGSRVDSRLPAAWGDAAARSVHAAELAGIQGHAPLSQFALRDRGRESERRQPAPGEPAARWRRLPAQPGRYRSWMTASRTRCAPSLADRIPPRMAKAGAHT